MKNQMLLLICFLSLFFQSCHKDKGCQGSNSLSNANVNLFDLNTASPHYNQVVAVFKFNQNSTAYSPVDSYSTCTRASDCTIGLNIQNTTSQQMTLDYNITATRGIETWNYQGDSTIPPGGNIEVGVINSLCLGISGSTILVQSAHISYQ